MTNRNEARSIYYVCIETLAIQLHGEHRAVDDTTSWFALSNDQRAKYRKMATGSHAMPRARKMRAARKKR